MLIKDWKKAWKLWSVQLNAVGLVILGAAEVLNHAWAGLAPTLAARVPHAQYIALVIFTAGIIARLINQEPKDGE